MAISSSTVSETTSKINIPVYGKSGFIVNEDRYVYKDSGLVESNSTYNSSSFGKISFSNQSVVFVCEGKKNRVEGFLTENIKIDGHADWEDMFGGGMSALAGSMLDTANKAFQLMNGSSLQQPWMSRKVWKQSKPFTINLNMAFVAKEDPEKEVVLPTLALISYCYPRFMSGSNAGELSSKAGVSSSSLAGAVASAGQLYKIPGPSLVVGVESENGSVDESDWGDYVSVWIGDFIMLQYCYITDVSVEYSRNLSINGKPLAARATVTVSSMDANFCSESGQFSLNSTFNEGTKKLSNLITTVANASESIASSAKDVFDAVIGFWNPSDDK